jgi:hypothetical protein
MNFRGIAVEIDKVLSVVIQILLPEHLLSLGSILGK